MSNKISLQILLNITFILMITWSENFRSNKILKQMNNTFTFINATQPLMNGIQSIRPILKRSSLLPVENAYNFLKVGEININWKAFAKKYNCLNKI